MRKAPCGWIVVLALGLAASASAGEKRIGIVGGALSSQLAALAGSTIVDQELSAQPLNKRIWGPMGGLIFEVGIGKVGAVRFEPKYVRKGTRLAVTIKGTNQQFAGPVELDYVSFPLFLRSTFFSDKKLNLVLLSGIGADYLLRARYQGFDTKEDFKSVEIGIASRIGIQGKIGENGLLGIHATLASSLARIDKRQTGQDTLKNGGFGAVIEFTTSIGGS
jgi:hypothetical protein